MKRQFQTWLRQWCWRSVLYCWRILPRWGTNAASFGNRIGQTRNAKVLLFSNTSAAHWSRRTTHQSTTTPPRNNWLTRQRNRRSWQSSEICPHGWVILFIASTILRLWRKKRLILWRDRQAMRLEWYDQSVWISALQAHPINNQNSNTHWYLCSGRQRFNHQRLWKTDPLKFLVTRPFEVSGYQTLWSFWLPRTRKCKAVTGAIGCEDPRWKFALSCCVSSNFDARTAAQLG